MAYGIVTGYYNTTGAEEFFKVWMANTLKYAKPAEIIVVNAAGKCLSHLGGTWVNTKHNYGHVKRMAPGEKHGGWWLGFMLGALICHCNKYDFIYKEQDCLAFGSWVKHIFVAAETAHAPVVVGQFTQHAYSVEQSLVLIKQAAILDFITEYMMLPEPESTGAGRPELKFLAVMKKRPELVTFMTMGCGRDRPIPYTSNRFYAQHLSPVELAELKARKLI